jgi:molybdenum-dependent DNA-binding transcriptional regulator ModE
MLAKYYLRLWTILVNKHVSNIRGGGGGGGSGRRRRYRRLLFNFRNVNTILNVAYAFRRCMI